MDSAVVADSCADFNDSVLGGPDELRRIPFKIMIDDEELIDSQLDTTFLLSRMEESRDRITTACPSPHDYLQVFQQHRNVFVVTISSRLSGSYNSAMTARTMLLETHPDHHVHVFDSKTATAGQSLVVLKVKQLLAEGLSPSQLIGKVNEYITHLRTFGVLQSLENLARNGRISNIKAFIGNLLHIVPIIGDNGNGEIVVKENARGTARAFARLLEMISKDCADVRNTVLSITYVNTREKAEQLKEMIVSRFPFKDVILFEAGGLSTVYAGDRGIMIAY
jgi:DegV family protein with EDD domain